MAKIFFTKTNPGTALILLLFFLIPLEEQAQDCSDTDTGFSTYYHQRKSLFEILPNSENEIIFLGDSITDGNNWAEMFNNLSVKNRGISGDGILGVICRIDEVLESKPDKIFLMIGTNDLAKGRSVEYVLSHYEKLIQWIQRQSPNTALYIESILPVNPDFGMFESHMKSSEEIVKGNNGLAELSKKYDLTYLDLYSDFVTSDSKLNPNFTNDGLHLTGAGYQKWQSLIRDYVIN